MPGDLRHQREEFVRSFLHKSAELTEPNLRPEWPRWWRQPDLWWPQDRAWCVATEIDLKSTYIGAHRACLQDLASLPGVEAATVAADLGVDWLSDTRRVTGRC